MFVTSYVITQTEVSYTKKVPFLMILSKMVLHRCYLTIFKYYVQKFGETTLR